MSIINVFCKYVQYGNGKDDEKIFRWIDPEIRQFMYKTAIHCIENNEGNIDIAHKIIILSQMTGLIENNSGLSSYREFLDKRLKDRYEADTQDL